MTAKLSSLMNAAAQKVAEKLENWTKNQVRVVSSEAEEIEAEDVCKVLLAFIDPVIIYSSLDGKNVNGISLTSFEKSDALTLATFLTGEKSYDGFLNEKQYSALRETSNVVSGTYANILANGVGKIITSTQPLRVNKDDLFDLEKNLKTIDSSNSKVKLLKAKFEIKKRNVNICLFLFFNKEFSNELDEKRKNG